MYVFALPLFGGEGRNVCRRGLEVCNYLAKTY